MESTYQSNMFIDRGEWDFDTEESGSTEVTEEKILTRKKGGRHGERGSGLG
jgi:hypothetical protein